MAASLNSRIADKLEETARLLEDQHSNPFRVRAYRRAAETVRRNRQSMLQRLPGIGEGLARSIRDMVLTGRLPMLDRLRGEADPIAVLMSVPGIGRVTAERIHDDLDIDTLEELEMAAHDGRLADIVGVGKKRLEGIIHSLEARLGRVRGAKPEPDHDEPSVEELLDVDREYREKSESGKLRRIAPRRFNASGEAWLPILHTQRGDRHYTALYSNTARAHRLETTKDWVVLYCDGAQAERQYTVITSRFGPTKGQRIVRGREGE
jgi:DNA polymerase (family 10)